jgi:hypothetical protein
MRLLLSLWLVACGADAAPADEPTTTSTAELAVTGVEARGSPGAYTFSVTVRSPDTGCEAFADWWEVLSSEGELRYRRVLLHSHVDEQPFTRTGGPVPVAADDVVWVRVHFNDGRYGEAMRGMPSGDFAVAEVPDGFAAGVETQPPLPEGCAF